MTHPLESRGQRLRRFLSSPQGKRLIWIACFFVVLAAAGVMAASRYWNEDEPTESNTNETQSGIDTVEIVEPPPTFFSTLDGTETVEALVNRRPLAVMVENHPEARPQAGLAEASHVWEVIVEGGITRFMAIYSPHDAEKIGPVRSARPYFVSWASGYRALYAHAGGSQAALARLSSTDEVTDLPHTSGYFHREPRAGVASEHTLFTSTSDLYSFAEKKGAGLEASVAPLTFANELALNERPASGSVTINFSSPTYQVNWIYVRERNAYDREMAGRAHIDRSSGQQLNSRNVVVLTVNRRYDGSTNHGKGEWFMTTEGEGKALIFQNGQVINGTWRKPTAGSMLELVDTSGAPVKLLRGQTWFEVVPPDVAVSHETAPPPGSGESQPPNDAEANFPS